MRDLGSGIWDLGPGIWDLGPGTWDLEPGTWAPRRITRQAARRGARSSRLAGGNACAAVSRNPRAARNKPNSRRGLANVTASAAAAAHRGPNQRVRGAAAAQCGRLGSRTGT